MRGISWLAANPVSFSRRTLLHGVSKYDTMCYNDVVGPCHLSTYLASLKTNIVLVSWCLQFVVVAVKLDWDGLPCCCDIYLVFRGWRHLRKGCWILYVEYDLLHNMVHLLWLWEFWIGISAWWPCWTCWRNPTVLVFRSSISVWLPRFRRGIYFL